MARITFMILALMTVAAPCLAEVGEFGIYTDPQGYICYLTDDGGGDVITLYVVHHFYYGDQATGSRFRIELSHDIPWLFLSIESPYGSSPGTLDDISLSYGACIGTSTSIATLKWLSTIPAPTCSTLSLKPVDGKTTVVATDCSFIEHPPRFMNFMAVNGCWCFDAAQPTTWGSVKALYR